MRLAFRRVAASLLALGIVAAAAAAGCGDPVHDGEVAALGPEAPGVSPGPTHRPGQPCLTCHGGEGPAGVTFVTAGTVYDHAYGEPGGTATTANALVGGVVHLVDANNLTYDATTNAVGNFFVTTDQWSATFPLGAKSQDGGPSGCIPTSSSVSAFAGDINVSAAPVAGCQGVAAPMASAIDRGGVYASCAYCHFDPPSDKSPGHVFVQ